MAEVLKVEHPVHLKIQVVHNENLIALKNIVKINILHYSTKLSPRKPNNGFQ